MRLDTKLFFIKFSIIFYFLNSCGTYDYIASGFSSEEEAVEEITSAEDELKSDLQDYVDSGGDFLTEEEDDSTQSSLDQLELAEEKLPPAPAQEYDSSLIVEENNDNNVETIQTSDETNIDSPPKIDFQQTKFSLKDKIQYRIATLSFRSGSSIVDSKALKKIKKIVDVAKKRNAKIKIVGHASTRTRDMPISEHKLVNFVISDKRAQSVAKAFISYKFPKENLITEAVSDSKPLFKENMPAGTQANQRTEIFLIY